MKTLKLQNKYVPSLYSLLDDFEWKGSKESRSSRKLKRLLERKFKELQEDKREIAKQYVHLTNEKEIWFDERGQWKPLPGKTVLLNKEIEALNDEEALLEYGEYVNDISEVYKILDNSENIFKGKQADALVEFLEAFEANKENKKEEK